MEDDFNFTNILSLSSSEISIMFFHATHFLKKYLKMSTFHKLIYFTPIYHTVNIVLPPGSL